MLKRLLRKLGSDRHGASDPASRFRSAHYLRINARRLEHLATLGLPLAGRRVLEVGAGPGDLTSFFLDRGCSVHATDARAELLAVLAKQHAGRSVTTAVLDLDAPGEFAGEPFDVAFCYGLLYHLGDPTGAIAYLASACRGMLLLESCVSYGDGEALNPVEEDARYKSQAVSGRGCRPTRGWYWARLRAHFPFVYAPATQPAHEEFPLDWTRDANRSPLKRAVFVASRTPIDHPLMLTGLPAEQRC